MIYIYIIYIYIYIYSLRLSAVERVDLVREGPRDDGPVRITTCSNYY